MRESWDNSNFKILNGLDPCPAMAIISSPINVACLVDISWETVKSSSPVIMFKWPIQRVIEYWANLLCIHVHESINHESGLTETLSWLYSRPTVNQINNIIQNVATKLVQAYFWPNSCIAQYYFLNNHWLILLGTNTGNPDVPAKADKKIIRQTHHHPGIRGSYLPLSKAADTTL